MFDKKNCPTTKTHRAIHKEANKKQKYYTRLLQSADTPTQL